MSSTCSRLTVYAESEERRAKSGDLVFRPVQIKTQSSVFYGLISFEMQRKMCLIKKKQIRVQSASEDGIHERYESQSHAGNS